MAIRIRVRRQDDDVVEDAQRLGIGVVVQSKYHLHELLGAEHLGGVQPTVDPDRRFPLQGQGTRFRLAHALGFGHGARDLTQAVDARVVLR